MAIYIPFDVRLPYLAVPHLGSRPALELTIHTAEHTARVLGILDSGSSITTFSEEVAARLGLSDITGGIPVRVWSVAGTIDVYLFDVEITVELGKFSKKFPAQVGFFHGLHNRNLLGRNLMFSHFRVGFEERNQEILIGAY